MNSFASTAYSAPEPQRAQRQRHARAFTGRHQQRGLQGERDQRGPEHQATIDEIAAARRLLARVQDRDRQVEGEEQQQERFGAGELVGVVLQHAPQRADAEGEGETQQVEDPPRPEPGDRQDRRIEHRVIGEQRHVVATAGGQPDRRHEAGEDAEDRQRLRILHDRQHADAGDQHDADGEGGAPPGSGRTS